MLGSWWLQRSRDGAHRRAYRNIADFIRASFIRPPGVIVDYGCGAGNLLSLLSMRFPHAKLIGLDGSSFLLHLALRRFTLLSSGCSKRISLIKTPLPNMNLLRGKATLAIFCFPNMVSSSAGETDRGYGRFLNNKERKVAGSISRHTGLSCGLDSTNNQDVIEQSRCIAKNLRRLLTRDGICIRIEYASIPRHKMSSDELTCVSFEEGSLEQKVEGTMAPQLFRLRASAYFRSRVLEDVYEQTGDDGDKNGGYLITVLQAI